MGSAGQQPEHPLGARIIRRLPQNLAFNNHCRVGREHEAVRHALADGVPLGVGDASDVDLWCLAGLDVLVYVSRQDLDVDPGLP